MIEDISPQSIRASMIWQGQSDLKAGISKPCLKPKKQIRQVAPGEYQAVLACHKTVYRHLHDLGKSCRSCRIMLPSVTKILQNSPHISLLNSEGEVLVLLQLSAQKMNSATRVQILDKTVRKGWINTYLF